MKTYNDRAVPGRGRGSGVQRRVTGTKPDRAGFVPRDN